MTDAPTLVETRAPWVVLTSRRDPWVAAGLAALEAVGGFAFRLDGRELLEPASLFRAFARELPFPGYFGHNWAALVDCLHDLHGPWHGNRAVAVLVDRADQLLTAEHLGLLVSMLCQAAWRANLRLDSDGFPDDMPAFPLHFVFLLDHLPAEAFTAGVTTDPDVTIRLTGGRLTAALTGPDWPGSG
ncbi:barstar family protein [Kitasatospora sp. NPDC004289]